MLHFQLLGLVLFQLVLHLLISSFFKSVIIALVIGQRRVKEVDNVGTNRIEELSGMTDHHHGVFSFL